MVFRQLRFFLPEEPETLVGDIQVRQGDAGIQTASLFTAPDMDGVSLMGEVPWLAVDGRGSQTGRFQSGIGGVCDLGESLALETLQIAAELVARGYSEEDAEAGIAAAVASGEIDFEKTGAELRRRLVARGYAGEKLLAAMYRYGY
jgi:hypothetical protein